MSDPPHGRPRPEGSGDDPASDRPRAVLCDRGELEDVYQLLRGLDPAPLRLSPEGLAALRPWERPSRLLITTVRAGLADDLSIPELAGHGVAVAVADDDARAQCARVLQRGFRYVVRRPVHPEALRMLLMQVLWRGPEHRVVARFPFGAGIGWRRGLRSGSGTMLEISAHGCRLACDRPFRVGDRLRLRVPAALTGSRDLRLRGRVVRRMSAYAVEDGSAQVAVRFERLSERDFAHLDALLAERASGPAVMASGPSTPPPVPRAPAGRRGPLRLRSQPEPAEAGSPLAAPPPPALDRRRRPRGLWQREVVTLDHESDRVRHTLLGSDLSVGGVRVEPNPLLRIGDRLRLALYDGSHAEPLVLDARVAHDEGRRGVGLVFLDPSDAARERLDRMVAGLPPLSSLASDGEKPQGVVLGEIVSREPDGPASRRGPEQQDHQPEHDQAAPEYDDEEA